MKKLALPLFQIGVLLITLIVILVCFFWLPPIAADFAIKTPNWSFLRYPMLISIYTTIMPFLLGIYEALKLTRIIQINEAFTEKAVQSLKIIKNCALIISFMYFVGLFILFNIIELSAEIAIIILIIVLAALLIGLICGILQELLSTALKIKEENDLTV